MSITRRTALTALDRRRALSDAVYPKGPGRGARPHFLQLGRLHRRDDARRLQGRRPAFRLPYDNYSRPRNAAKIGWRRRPATTWSTWRAFHCRSSSRLEVYDSSTGPSCPNWKNLDPLVLNMLQGLGSGASMAFPTCGFGRLHLQPRHDQGEAAQRRSPIARHHLQAGKRRKLADCGISIRDSRPHHADGGRLDWIRRKASNPKDFPAVAEAFKPSANISAPSTIRTI